MTTFDTALAVAVTITMVLAALTNSSGLMACALGGGIGLLVSLLLKEASAREDEQRTTVTCPRCDGLGKDAYTLLPCSRCHGTGRIHRG